MKVQDIHKKSFTLSCKYTLTDFTKIVFIICISQSLEYFENVFDVTTGLKVRKTML